MVANLGDSRAVMIGTSENGEIKVVQLTTDLKPSVPSKLVMLGNRDKAMLVNNVTYRFY